MKKVLAFLLVIFMIPGLAHAAKLTVVGPPGAKEVTLLSGGTMAVLNYQRAKLNKDLKTYNEQYRVGQLAQEAAAAKLSSDQKQDAYQKGGKAIKQEYIGKLRITINKVSANISTESSLGEVAYSYTATNHSDRIISNITYVPRIGNLRVPAPTMLMLEFIDPITLKFGIAPGKSLSNKMDNPERFSFLTGEISKADLAYIKANINKSFWLEAQDIHFMNTVDYKDQSKMLNVEQAFAGRLGELRQIADAARRDADAKAATLATAQAGYTKATKAAKQQFQNAAKNLRKASVRFTQKVDDDNTCVFKDLPPGSYVIHATDGKSQAAWKEIVFTDSNEKVKLSSMTRDPFAP